MEKSESIKELATALCNFQGAVETIKKSEVNPFFKSKYADLSIYHRSLIANFFYCVLSAAFYQSNY